MAELIRNPQTMKRARAEVEEIVGCNKKVEESDTERLPYLQAVMKEVLRLHPPAPLLLPHRADASCEIAGFVIPKNRQVIVNAWAIGRDPASWTDPLEFIPERFLELERDYKGHDFELIPFGAGRRICVGIPLAIRMLPFVLASLLHSFDWSLPDGMNERRRVGYERQSLESHSGKRYFEGNAQTTLALSRLRQCIDSIIFKL
eukprot:Gb_15956 [translate_table: standard]